ncbi:MAG: hypothetical protein HY000_20255 [Planctomycetes bacterium]|nr:hypothetical protein [Planctomycetota bacterium]
MLLRSHLTLALAALALAVGLAGGNARAQDKKDATGTWKFSVTFNDQTFETTLKLKQEGEKLTGTATGRGGTETEISDGTVKDGAVSFSVVRERDGQKFTTKYNGKLEGDSIKGTRESNFGGQARTADWEAKRAG